MTSRYSSSRYDGERRSRSPRERSPDRYERNSQYGGDNDRRRSSVEARSNVSAYQNNRDAFRGDLTREPPRGPKALIDAPSGPRGGGHSGDYRGRGRGRGRAWGRDASRERQRDMDFRGDRGWERDDFRDRRDTIYRDDRSREREREWRDNREPRDGFRGRRPSPGRGRSPPPPMRDFRDRDPPLAVDPDRSRRGSRDGGPPSAGSSNSDAPFGFRGGFRGGRGRGWDRGRGRGGGGPGGGGYYDDRDRFPRARSQEGRWGRDDRDRGDRPDRGERWPERDARPDPHDREPPRELFRAKMERAASSQAPSPINTKDVSPPPIAPSAPAFGSVPSRNTGPSDAAANGTAKPPPTGPRAFNADRPTSSGHPGQGDSQGSKLPSSDGNPSIPLGPRSQQQQKPQRPSSKQWINPALAGKRESESPKVMRSQSFAQQPRPFDFQGENGRTDFSDYDRRPRSSGARSDSRMASPDSQMRGYNAPEPGEIPEDEDDQPSRDAFERDHQYRNNRRDFFRPSASDHQPYRDTARRPSYGSSVMDTADRAAKPTPTPAVEPPSVAPAAPASPVPVAAPRKSILRVPIIRFSLPPRDLQATSSDEPSESDDDEDYGEYIATEIAKKEAALQQLESVADDTPDRIVAQYARVSHEAMVRLVSEPEGLVEMMGSAPKELPPPEEPETLPVEKKVTDSPKMPAPVLVEETDKAVLPEAPSTEIETEAPEAPEVLQPQPKMEDVDMDDVPPVLPDVPAAPPTEPPEKSDIPMQDAEEASKPDAEVAPQPEPEKTFEKNDKPLLMYPPGEPIETIEHDKTLPTTPSQVEDDEDATTTESDEFDPMILDLVRDVATPSPHSMPKFDVLTWNNDKDFMQSLDSDPMIDDFISKELDRVHLIKAGEQGIVRQEYADNYSKYLQFTLSSDPAAARSREKFVSNPPPPDTTVVAPPPPEPKPEGRGTGRRYASERDLERILQESKREEEERKERELRAQQDRFRSEKEAIPPDMYWNKTDRDNEAFVDSSGLVSVEQIASTWHLLPPINNFTEQEAERFEKGYLESIKQWGVIAENIENRDFKTCIQYYYLMKKELNLKEKLKKQPKRKKKGGRAKTRSSALVSELGNAENENEENPETGENGERRRPRRAAAPTWGYEQPPTDSDNATPAGTPGRRSAKGGEVGPEKPDGRKNRRRAKDKEPKAPKGQTLVPGATGSGKGRSRSNSRVPIPEPLQGLPTTLGESRLPAQPEGPSAIQPPFPSLQPQQLPVVPERPMGLQGSTISEVMAPPSLRPEPPPPPQPAMTTFDLGQPQPPLTTAPTLPQSQPQAERRTHVQPSSYWSVSETDVFPGLLRAFGSDWQAMAAHMGSKTAVMVKNYYVRQRDSNKPEWERLLSEADAKKARGEKRPDPPAPPTQTGRKKYDATTTTQNRPLASASRELAGDVTPGKMETTPVPTPNQSYGRFPAVPIAQAPPAQQQQQPQQPQQPQQQPQPHQPLAQVPQQQQPLPISQHAMGQPMVTQAMSPNARPLRAPLQPGFGYLDQPREPLQPQQQGVRISQKPPAPEHAPPRTLAAAQPLQSVPPGHQEHMERQKMDMQQPKDMHNPLERTRLPQEAPGPASHHPYEPFSLHRPMHRGDPLAPPARQPQESLRQESLRQDSLRQDALRQDSLRQDALRQDSLRQESLRQDSLRGTLSAPQPFSQPVQQQNARGLLGDPSQPQTGTPPAQRPMSTAQRQMVGHHQGEPYPPQQQSPPVQSPAPHVSRPPPQERKTSNLMSLLNDDPPQPKRAPEPVKPQPPTSTPTPGPMSRPPPGPKPPVGLELRPEGSRGYMQYVESGPPPPSGMPSLKPSYTASPQAQHLNPPRSTMASPHEAAGMERDYYRYGHHQPPPQPAPPSSGSPPAHHYPAPSHVSRDSYSGPPPGSYPPYGGPTSHAGSPPPAYAVHQQGARAREPPPPNRETAWPQATQGHGLGQPQQQPGWPKQNQPPPQQQSWNSPHGQPGKPQTPAPMGQQPAWAAPPPQQQQQQPPPQQQHHLSLREERGPPSMYGQPAPPQHQLQHHQHQHQHPHQHTISGRFPPPSSRPPEPLPPQAQQAFPPRYASTPGPREHRDQIQPPRSYTPGAHFDNRGPPPGPYPPDPREMQLRDHREMQHRDHREMLAKQQQQEQEQQQRQQQQQQQQQQQHAMMNRQLRPGDGYDRPPDRFSR